MFTNTNNRIFLANHNPVSQMNTKDYLNIVVLDVHQLHKNDKYDNILDLKSKYYI